MQGCRRCPARTCAARQHRTNESAGYVRKSYDGKPFNFYGMPEVKNFSELRKAMNARAAALRDKVDVQYNVGKRALDSNDDAEYQRSLTTIKAAEGTLAEIAVERAALENEEREYASTASPATAYAPLAAPPGANNDNGAPQLRSVADALADHPAYKQYASGDGERAVRFVLRNVGLTRLALTRAASDPHLRPQFAIPAIWGGPVSPLPRRTRVRDLIPFGGVNAPYALAFAKETGIEGAPSKVAENAVIPSVHFSTTPMTTTQQTLAALTTVSEQVLFYQPSMQQWVSQRLTQLLLDAEDEYLLNDATAGLIVNATAFVPTAGAAGWQSMRTSFGDLEAVGDTAIGVVVAPLDFAAMETAVDLDKRPILQNAPTGESPRTIFGVPVATSVAIPAGKFLTIGAGSCALFEGRSVTIDFNSTAYELWSTNKVGVRIRSEIAVAVYRNTSLQYGSLLGA